MPIKKVMKNTVKEQKAVKGLAFIIESELDKSSAILAVKGITEKLQKMAKDLADMEGNDILPILDSMRLTFGPELTDHFREATVAKIRQTMDSVMNADEAIAAEIGRLETHVNGGMTNDMAGLDDMSGGNSLGGGVGDDIEMGAKEDGLGDEAPDMEMGAEEDGAPPEEGGDDLDAAFDAAASDTTAAGRARKESIERNVKALRESRNPDRLVFETFRRTLTESKDAVRSARAVATAFAIDFEDVVAIVREGKTFKDEKGRSEKPWNKDRTEDRKTKKRDRPSDIDEAKEEDPCWNGYKKVGMKEKGNKKVPNCVPESQKLTPKQSKAIDKNHNGKVDAQDFDILNKDKKVEEGKTFKDEKGRSEKPWNKDRTQDRSTKKRERPSDMDECEVTEGKTFKDEKDRSKNPWGKDRSDQRSTKKRERPSDLDENKVPPEGKDHHKKEAERYTRLAREARNQTTSANTPEYYEKMAKKHADLAKGFKTGGVAESARDAAATTRAKAKVEEASDSKPTTYVVSWYRPKGKSDLPEGGQLETHDREKAKAKLDEKRKAGFEVDMKSRKGTKPVEEATGVKALIMKKRTEPKPFAKPFKAPTRK
jgi:hypothetical protein